MYGGWMTRPDVVPVALLGMLIVAGCSTTRVTATSEQVRQTKDGGTILLHNGDKPQAAARYALATMESHCKGPYEIVEIAKAGTGQSVTHGAANDSAWVSTTSQVSGTALTYVCRKPQDTDMNVKLATFASEDMLGKACSSDRDCGVFACTKRSGQSPASVCTAPDGSIPFALEGEPCDKKGCIAPYVCYRTDSFNGTACKYLR
jgi:hypothetical protein